MTTRLTAELVPSSSWYRNVRSNVSPDVWDQLRRSTYRAARYRCEICAGRGSRHPVECHEVWAFDDETRTQRLVRLIALCPACHEVKHLGFAATRGRLDAALDHLARVNGWTRTDADLYAEAMFELHASRSRHDWNLDLSFLDGILSTE